MTALHLEPQALISVHTKQVDTNAHRVQLCSSLVVGVQAQVADLSFSLHACMLTFKPQNWECQFTLLLGLN